MLKNVLFAISLSLTACGPGVPEFPEVTQYAVKNRNVAKPGFYGVNNKTGARVFRSFSDPAMDGAQALDARDYRESESWVQAVKAIAEERCR